MYIIKKNYLSCLFIGILMSVFMIVGFVHYDTFDYHGKFGVWLFFISFILFGLRCIVYYFDSLEKAHCIDIKEGVLLYDGTKHPIDDSITFKLTYDGANAIWISLFIGDKSIFKRITFNADEFDALIRLVKPYLKYPKIAENINFHELKLFEGGFFIGRKKFYYEDIVRIEVLKYANHYDTKIFEFHIDTEKKSYKKIVLQRKNREKVDMLIENFASS